MKKNVLILIGLCLLGLCTWQVQAANMERISNINKEVEDDVPHGYDKIVLQGTLMYGINPNAIVAGASDDAVYIGWFQPKLRQREHLHLQRHGRPRLQHRGEYRRAAGVHHSLYHCCKRLLHR